jgi:hypothetical protein
MKLYWRKTPFTWIASKAPFDYENKFAIEEGGDPPNDILTLTMELLNYGGKKVCIRYPETDMKSLLKNGALFQANGLILNLKEDRECHSNCSKLWLENKKELSICTGYGLTEDDQMWRQHTWLLKSKEKIIIETTVKREKYYGIILTGLSASLFAKANE